MGLLYVLSLRVRMDQGVMAMKGYPIFLKALGLVSASDGLESYQEHSLAGVTYLSTKMQSVNSTAPADRAG